MSEQSGVIGKRESEEREIREKKEKKGREGEGANSGGIIWSKVEWKKIKKGWKQNSGTECSNFIKILMEM